MLTRHLRIHSRSRGFVLLMAFAVFGLSQPIFAASDESRIVAAARASLSSRAWQLATDGKLEDVWRQVESLADQAEDDAAVAALREDIAGYRDHERDRRAETRAAYDRSMEKLREHADQGEVRKAISEAVRAYGLAEDPEELLADEEVRELITVAEERAAEHEQNAEWLDALSYYRALDQLFKGRDDYRDRLRNVARHVGLLRLYAPDALFDLYVKEAEERGDEPPEPWSFDEDRWQAQLEGIEPAMLTQSIALGAGKHVEGSSFEDLLLGGIEGIKLLFDTDGVENTFPAVGDPEKAEPFLDYLDETRLSIVERNTPLSYSGANDILNRILRNNADTVALPPSVVIHEFGDGAMSTLDDFSSIVWPHQMSQFERTTSGKFSGVGIQIQLIDRQLTVISPLEDTPAQRAGIRSGDQIVTIDEKSTVGIDLDQAVDRITGEEGSTVVLGIKSPGDDEARDVPLVRSTIKIVSVKGWEHRPGGGWGFYIDPGNKIGYVRMTTFGPNTADELDAAVQQMTEDRGLSGFILDLRRNPGGRLDAAVDVANRFLNEGTIVSTTQETFLGRTWRAEADATHTYDDFPVIVLVDNGSASASEIVSGALQDHGRALVVGERTFGKGSVQNLLPIGGEDALLKLTTQYYKLPDGRIIHRRPGADNWGVNPDVPVDMTDEQTAEVMKARMVLDVLRADDAAEAVDLSGLFNTSGDDDAENTEANEEEAPPVESPQDILDRGMDPQLETALLLLKTRLLADSGS